MLVIAITLALAAEPQKTSVPADAAWHAAVDASQLNPFDRPFTRYVWIPDRSRDYAAAVNFAVNLAASTSRTIQYPVPVAGGLLLKYDIRQLCPDEKSARNFADTWEKLADHDPWFHADSFLVERRKVAPYKASDGKTYDFVFKRVRQFGLGADVNSLLTLRTLLGTDLPIAEASWLMGWMLTAVDGGLYYQFRGIEKNPAKGTAQDAYLESLGADPKAVGERAADERAAIIRSKVTGKPRCVVVFFGRNVRPSVGQPLVTLTLDVQAGDIDAAQDPLRNLIKFKFRATEAIGVLPNGLQIYALFNAKGERQDSVPDNIASDSTIPFPHDRRLQPAISCIRCHCPDDGLKPFVNDAKKRFDGGLAPLADFGSKKPTADVLDQIRGLYTGDLGPTIAQARTAQAIAAYRATGGIYGPESMKRAGQILGTMYQRYFLDDVTPQIACEGLGYLIDDADDATAAFGRIVPPLPRDATGTSPEDIYVATLRDGDSITRAHYEHIYQDLLLRSLAERLRQNEEAHLKLQKNP